MSALPSEVNTDAVAPEGTSSSRFVQLDAGVVGDTVARGDAGAARVVQVWDLPLRIFHWSLVIAIVAAYITAEFGGSAGMKWHGRIGTFVLALLMFRLVWGFVGTRHARFGSFLPTPSRVGAYLQGRWRGIGHNPLGALSVVALLALVAAQVVTGLFANDDISFAGPLSEWVGKSWSDGLTGWHAKIFYGLAGFIALHVLAVLFYLSVRRTNLVSAMVTGNKPAAIATVAPVLKHFRWRLAAAVLVAATVPWLVWRQPATPEDEVTTPPAATADW